MCLLVIVTGIVTATPPSLLQLSRCRRLPAVAQLNPAERCRLHTRAPVRSSSSQSPASLQPRRRRCCSSAVEDVSPPSLSSTQSNAVSPPSLLQLSRTPSPRRLCCSSVERRRPPPPKSAQPSQAAPAVDVTRRSTLYFSSSFVKDLLHTETFAGNGYST
nr:hypothetical protein Iba_chr04fCG15250 [Ipomoea batatas]